MNDYWSISTKLFNELGNGEIIGPVLSGLEKSVQIASMGSTSEEIMRLAAFAAVDAINNKSINEASLRQAVLKLSKLNLVLSKLNDDDFGICLKCKQPIPVGRILIRPESLLCVNCAK